MNERLWQAAHENLVATCREVLNHHMRGDICAQVNSKSDNDWTALHIAAWEGSTDVCKILIEYALEVDLNARSDLQQTPLHLAAERGFLDIVQLLVNAGADVGLQDRFGRTVLHLVATYNHVDTACLLLGKDPPIAIRDNNGRTAYASSTSREMAEVFELYFHERGIAYIKRVIPDSLARPEPRQDQIDRLLLKAKRAESPQAMEVFADRAKRPVYDIDSAARWKGEIDESEFPHAEYSDFTLICLLGKGAFGEVYLVQKRDTGQEFAMKVLNKHRLTKQNLMKYAIAERNVLTYISHPFIVALHYAFQTPEKLVLILDYCPGGDLSELLRKKERLTEKQAKLYICEILLALEELHSRDIIYRDLKPANVVLDAAGHALLTDFGLSKEGVTDTSLTQSFCGSVSYLAPEMLCSAGHNKTVDYYLLGVLLYEMLVGAPPYYDSQPERICFDILSKPVPIPNYISPKAANLLTRLLEKDPSKRLGAGGITEIKGHKFFEGISWTTVYSRELSPGPVERQRMLSGLELSAEEVFGTLWEQTEPLKGWSFIQPALSSQSCIVQDVN
jgi:serine/threonine protein kinase